MSRCNDIKIQHLLDKLPWLKGEKKEGGMNV